MKPARSWKWIFKLSAASLALLLAIGIGGACIIAFALMPWLFFPATTDMTPICLHTKNIAGEAWLSIPRAYLPYGSDRHSGELKSFPMEFNYKDLQPWSLMPAGTTLSPPRYPSDNVAIQDNWANLIISAVLRKAPPYEPFRGHLATDGVSPFPQWKRLNENDASGHTFDYPVTDSSFIYVECDGHSENPQGSCTVVERYRGLLATYWIRSAHLMQLDYFSNRVHQLLDQFITSKSCSK